MNKNRKRTKCARKIKDNFTKIYITCSNCMHKGKLVILIFKDIDALLQLLEAKGPSIQR